jgi:hypothetical protein
MLWRNLGRGVPEVRMMVLKKWNNSEIVHDREAQIRPPISR